jgi:phage shock protein A
MSEDATGPDPATQDELVTLEAELRRALQHQRAEMERAREAQEEVSRLIERARAALERAREGPKSFTAKNAKGAKTEMG